MQAWLVLVYKLPSEPSRYRTGIWRKLKAAGAIYLQNGVVALPAGKGSERVMHSLAHEIREVGGTAYLFGSHLLGDEAGVVSEFNAARDDEYREVLGRCRDFHAELDKERQQGKFTYAELEENEEDLEKLSAWLGKIVARDHFGAELGAEAEAAVAACREDLDAFAREVYRLVDHGSATLPDTVDRHTEPASQRQMP